MAVVMLYGDLREFGNRHQLAVNSAAEAIRALTIQIEGLRAKLSQGGYFVRIAKHDVSPESIETDIHREINDDDVIHIVPEAAGGGRFGQILVGIALIVASFYVPMAGWAAQAVLASGISLTVGGIAQLLIKPPSFNASQGSDQSRTSSFTNLDNIAPQGAHVPIAYGYLEVGSVVISQSIESYDLTAAKSAGEVNYVRRYHQPVPYQGNSPNAADDEVMAHNYTLVEE